MNFLLALVGFFSGLYCNSFLLLILRVETLNFFLESYESSFLRTCKRVWDDSRIFMNACSVSEIVLSNSSLASYFLIKASLSTLNLSVKLAISHSIDCFSSSSLRISSWRSSLPIRILSIYLDKSWLYLWRVAP